MSILMGLVAYLLGGAMIVLGVRRANTPRTLDQRIRRRLLVVTGAIIVSAVILLAFLSADADDVDDRGADWGAGSAAVAVIALVSYLLARSPLRRGDSDRPRSRNRARLVTATSVLFFLLPTLLIVGIASLVVGSSGTEPTASAPPSSTGDGSGGALTSPSDQVNAYLRLKQAQKAALRPGVIVYKPPSPMRLGDTQIVVVRAADLVDRAAAQATLGAPDSLRVHGMPVGFDLDADLSGEDFDVLRIDNHVSGRRSVLDDDVAEWRWQVKPTRAGPKKLTLTVQVVADSGPIDFRYFDESVQVTPNLGYSVQQFAKTYWSATGLTVPVVGGLLYGAGRRLRRRRMAATGDGPNDEPTTGPPPVSDSARHGGGYL